MCASPRWIHHVSSGRRYLAAGAAARTGQLNMGMLDVGYSVCQIMDGERRSGMRCFRHEYA